MSTNQIASYIDALIPGSIGLLLLASPRLFTKAQGEEFTRTSKKLRIIGVVLLVVACVTAAMTFTKSR